MSTSTEYARETGRAAWSGKLAFVLSAAASAVGLGAMWRFPYLAAKYGGGTFLITYLVFVFTIGIALLLLETSLGRKTGQSAIGAFKAFGKKYLFIGVFMSAVPFIIVPYYCVIGGWVTKYLAAYAAGEASQLVDGGTYFTSFITNGPESIIFMLIFMVLTYIIVWRGVNKGIEKANLIMMPALIVMALGIAIYSLMLPGALDGVVFYLIPDVSKFSPELVISALGQTFFTLSLAMGIMVTYGSYLDKSTKLTSSVGQIAGTTFGVSLLAGFMIVPATFATMGSGEAVAENSGPSLMFVVLPQVFQNLGDFAGIVATVFFLLVLFAALTSSISLVETCTSIVADGIHCSRGKALTVVAVWTTLMGLVVTLGYSSLDFIQPLGEGSSILDFLDFISNSVMMPLAALMTCVFVGWIIGPKTLEDEVMLSAPFKARKVWAFSIRYIAPIVLVVILVAYVAQTLGFFSM
ncbi:MAG: sodium-dependent transporter [Coriobacteriia bacterium]|nr:sodium-dependent transporter [Coriobacteriia bacterium]